MKRLLIIALLLTVGNVFAKDHCPDLYEESIEANVAKVEAWTRKWNNIADVVRQNRETERCFEKNLHWLTFPVFQSFVEGLAYFGTTDFYGSLRTADRMTKVYYRNYKDELTAVQVLYLSNSVQDGISANRILENFLKMKLGSDNEAAFGLCSVIEAGIKNTADLETHFSKRETLRRVQEACKTAKETVIPANPYL